MQEAGSSSKLLTALNACTSHQPVSQIADLSRSSDALTELGQPLQAPNKQRAQQRAKRKQPRTATQVVRDVPRGGYLQRSTHRQSRCWHCASPACLPRDVQRQCSCTTFTLMGAGRGYVEDYVNGNQKADSIFCRIRSALAWTPLQTLPCSGRWRGACRSGLNLIDCWTFSRLLDSATVV